MDPLVSYQDSCQLKKNKKKTPQDAKKTKKNTVETYQDSCQFKKQSEPRPTKPDVRGFYDGDDNDLDSQFMAGARKPGGAGGYQVISPVTRTAREEEIDMNLGMFLSCFLLFFIY